ncbi:MAG: hypothetical protein K9K93_00385 [Acholeplasmataceae bacterium]|nr:hypothetical protein [Acholeplasmataceae bacterium]
MNTCDTVMTNGPIAPLDVIEQSIRKTYKTELLSRFIQAIIRYELMGEGDHVAVAISGGKDSLLMAKLFQELKRHNKYPFKLSFIAMDPGYDPSHRALLEANCDTLGIPVRIFETDIFRVLDRHARAHPCFLCARMRRGHLYTIAKSLGANKLALGHHYDDVIETTLLNLFYSHQFKTMVPKIQAENYEGIELIRPMVLIREHDILRFAISHNIPQMACACTVTAKKVSSKRREVKQLIAQLKQDNPDIEKSIFSAAANIDLGAVYGVRINEEIKTFNDLYKEGRNKI